MFGFFLFSVCFPIALIDVLTLFFFFFLFTVFFFFFFFWKRYLHIDRGGGARTTTRVGIEFEDAQQCVCDMATASRQWSAGGGVSGGGGDGRRRRRRRREE